jgi:hypothetical protein
MGATVWRFLSRGPGAPLPDDEILLEMVPAGVFVPYKDVQQRLVAARRAEDTDWLGVTASEWGWIQLLVDSAAVSVALRQAIDRRVLICTAVRVDSPALHARLAAFCASIFRRLGFAPARPPQAQPVHSRAETEAAAVLDALGF